MPNDTESHRFFDRVIAKRNYFCILSGFISLIRSFDRKDSPFV